MKALFNGCDGHDFPVWRSVDVTRQNGEGADVCGLEVAEETPLAIAYNGFAHAVMMGSPRDLEDFAVGFSVAEGVARTLDDLKAIDIAQHDDGIAVAITLAPDALGRYLAGRRVRALRGNTSCGLCGVEDLAQVRSPAAARVCGTAPLDPAAVRRAFAQLRAFQPLSVRTHGAHAAAWADRDGALLLVREDVGRHNALDKLVGAALRARCDLGGGFCVITSRCSYEMVQKAVAAGIPALVAVSAPTALAIRTAQAAGLTLLTQDRGSGGHLIYASLDDRVAKKHEGVCP